MLSFPASVKNRVNGFSLLELIIVLVIMGVLIAAVTLSISDTREDKLRLEARRLAARLTLAVDEAILSNQDYGLEVETDRYRFLVLDDQTWIEVSSEEEKHLLEQTLPEGMELQLQVEGLFAQFQTQDDGLNKMFKEYEEGSEDNSEDVARLLRPQIYLMSSGELNPFSLLIGFDDENPVFYQLEGTYDGDIVLQGPIREPMSYVLGIQQ